MSWLEYHFRQVEKWLHPKCIKYRYRQWKFDVEVVLLARKRYKVISEMGTGWLKEVISEKEAGKEYWEAVLDTHVKRITWRP